MPSSRRSSPVLQAKRIIAHLHFESQWVKPKCNTTVINHPVAGNGADRRFFRPTQPLELQRPRRTIYSAPPPQRVLRGRFSRNALYRLPQQCRAGRLGPPEQIKAARRGRRALHRGKLSSMGRGLRLLTNAEMETIIKIESPVLVHPGKRFGSLRSGCCKRITTTVTWQSGGCPFL